MKDLFGEFMEELRRRQEAEAARARGKRSPHDPGEPEAERSDESEAEPPTDQVRSGPRRWDDSADEGEAPRAPDDETDQAGDDADRAAGAPAGEADHDADQAAPEPIRIRRGRSGGRGGRRPPPPRRRTPGGPNDGAPGPLRALRRATFALVALVILIALFLGGAILDLWTDAIWFKSVGYDAVFWTRVGTQAALFVGGLIVALLVLLGNVWIAGRLGPPPDPAGRGTIGRIVDRMNEASRAGNAWQMRGFGPGDDRYTAWAAFPGRGGPPRNVTPDAGEELPDLTPLARWVLVGIAILLALGVAASTAGAWETFQLYANRVPYAPSGSAVVDPIFGRDITFFLFELPFFRLIQSIANALLVGALLVSVGRYLVSGLRGDLRPTTAIRVHLAVLAGLYLLSVAAGYQLDKFELVYSTRGVATGVSFTDANAQFLALDVLTVVAALSAAFLVGGAFTRMIWPLGVAVGVWLVASVVLGSVYPALIQQLTVLPNQFAQEQQYIKNNVAMTRLAYSLGSWTQIDYGGEQPLTANAVSAEKQTFDSARVWDYRPLRDVIDQVQTVRQYYDFTDVDTDRYQIDGTERQVMLSARELAPEKNPQASSWVNQKLTFTHGVGAVVVPVNDATPAGQPVLFVRDLPPTSTPGVPTIDQFRIYFGERPSDWVLTGARQNEFDYPVGTDQSSGDSGLGQVTRWSGTTGIRIDSTLTRLLFAARFRDLNLLISDQVTSESQLLFHRSLSDRLGLIAPFLRFDKDPYLVIRADGSLAWIQDAYTVSDRFPNAQPFDPTTLPAGTGLGDAPIDYLRNSIKIVENAYDGTLTFYVSDPTDPIIRAYERVFPTLFRPISAMPADLVPHLRYPEELFNVQARMFATYHVTDPSAFYNREDLWTVPVDAGSDQTLPAEAYYVVMRMPGEPSTEFLLLQPMVPQKRPNMIAWVAVRNDAPNYGQVRVYRFAENTSVLGPNQIEAKIDADPTISAQVSLWNQSGSKVIRGNLIVMPIQDSLIYLQPVYLQSTSSAFPELQKVIIATSSKVVWGDTLAEAIQAQLGTVGTPGGPGPSAGPTPSPGASPGTSPTPAPSAPSGDVASLVAYANQHFQLAQAALRAGDFATYGNEMALVQSALQRLATLTGATPAP